MFLLFRHKLLHSCGSFGVAWIQMVARQNSGRATRAALQSLLSEPALLGEDGAGPVLDWLWSALDRRKKGELAPEDWPMDTLEQPCTMAITFWFISESSPKIQK